MHWGAIKTNSVNTSVFNTSIDYFFIGFKIFQIQ